MESKKIFLAAVAFAAVGAGALGVGTSFAAEDGEKRGSFNGLAEAIATHFELDVEEVREFMKDHRQEVQTEHRERHEERRDAHFAKLVEDGKLTQTQADALEAKMEEMKMFGESLKDMELEERRDAMKEQREAMDAWAEEQGIDLKEVMPPPHHRPGPKGPMGPVNSEQPIAGRE